MQLVGLPLLLFVIWFGFSERDFDKISAFDGHALVMVLVGCVAAILSSSSVTTAWRTLTCLRELIPFCDIFAGFGGACRDAGGGASADGRLDDAGNR